MFIVYPYWKSCQICLLSGAGHLPISPSRRSYLWSRWEDLSAQEVLGKWEIWKDNYILILAQRGFLLKTESGLKFKIFHRNPANTHCFHLSLAAIAVILIEHHDVSMYTMLRRLPMAQQCCWYQNIINIKVADDDDDDAMTMTMTMTMTMMMTMTMTLMLTL